MDRRRWNLVADEFEDLVFDITQTDLNDAVGRYVNSVPTSPKSSVLVDLGCGIGSFIKRFGDRFHEIVGVEFASRTIARAKKSLKGADNVSWLTMDLDKAADVIGPRGDLTACLNVVTSPSPAKRRRMWASIANVTKPRGYALIVVPSLESEMMVHEASQKGNKRTPLKAPDGVVRIDDDARQKFFRRDELIADLARHGFKTLRVGRVFYPWSEEGLKKPRGGTHHPYGWICLAQRVGVDAV